MRKVFVIAGGVFFGGLALVVVAGLGYLFIQARYEEQRKQEQVRQQQQKEQDEKERWEKVKAAIEGTRDATNPFGFPRTTTTQPRPRPKTLSPPP